MISIAAIFFIVFTIILFIAYWNVKDRSAFSALIQAWATIALVALTAVYVSEIREANSEGPTVGIYDVKVQFEPNDTNYENLKSAKVTFWFKNMGKKPIRNLRFENRGVLGNLELPFAHRSLKAKESSIIYPGMPMSNTASIGKDALDHVIAGEKLIYTLSFEYSDWNNKVHYSEKQPMSIIVSPNPLRIGAQAVLTE